MTDSAHFGEMEVTVRATIRTCREEDLPALEWMGLYSRHRDIIRNAFEAQRRGKALMLLAVSAGFPIAQVWIDFRQCGRTSCAVLWAVRTFYPLQGSGIGRRIMCAAERILARRGVERARLEVENADRDVLGFYRKLGWRIVGHPEDRRGDEQRFLLVKEIGEA